MTLTEGLAAALAIAGAFFTFVAALGAVRLPDLYTRMHAATKATCFGVGLVVLAVAVGHPSWTTAMKAIMIIGFLFLTTPIAAHLLSRVAYRMRVPISSRTEVDEIAKQTSDPRGPSPE